MPPYVIFHDTTLRELARLKPTSVEALRHVYGVGERKAQDLGAAVLAVIGGRGVDGGGSREAGVGVGAAAPAATL